MAATVDASSAFTQRGISDTRSDVTVTASVPSADEVIDLLGVDLYADGIQPVWLQIENRRDTHVRVALFSIDEDYFPPMEIAWAYRKDFDADSRARLESWLLDSALPRYIPAGGTRSGFVYTNAVEGTKGFNLDVYAEKTAISFTFFVPLPGFRPDYMDVDFRSLYADEEITTGDAAVLRTLLTGADSCTTNVSGETPGDPLNVVLVGSPRAVRLALLRGDWQETLPSSPLTQMARLHHYRGRPPDGVFYKSRPGSGERRELRLWLAPYRIDDKTVWLGAASQDLRSERAAVRASKYRLDPNLDAARMFVLQNLWYSQSLAAFAMAAGVEASTIEQPAYNFAGAEYFTDGLRAVLFVAEEATAMDDTSILFWEPYVLGK